MFNFESHRVSPESVKITFTDYADMPQFTSCKIHWRTESDEGGVTLYLPYKARVLTDVTERLA
jgi:hypothetical protein